jgi:hypothetical protein
MSSAVAVLGARDVKSGDILKTQGTASSSVLDVLDTKMRRLKAAAEANELYGAQEAADQLWMQLGDILEYEYLPAWDRLKKLRGANQTPAQALTGVA